jgi:pimeloyl-ACP methyl ester carboxylesterase
VLIAALYFVAVSAGALERVGVEPGVELEYTVRGRGEPVILVHAGLFAHWFQPLLEEKALTGRYRVVSFYRIGYAGSGRVAGGVTLARQAQHVVALMRHLGIERAHVVGHSSGANIALQLALDAPERVQSLALLEPALPVSDGPDRLLSTRQSAIAPIIGTYRDGDKAAAVDAFMRMVAGSDYRGAFDRALPGEFARGLADADTFFQQELPAIAHWRLAREDAARFKQPALAVIGEHSRQVSPIWEARQQQLLSWLANAEAFVLPGATHLLHLQNPRAMALGLATFFTRHPIANPR